MRHILRQHIRKAVLVTLKNGTGFRGVMFDADPDGYLLMNAGLMEGTGSDRQPIPADGQVFIQRADVAFIQFL